MFAFMSYLEVKRINIIREEGSKHQPNFWFKNYLAVKRINIIREERSKYQPNFCFHELSCSQTY